VSLLERIKNLFTRPDLPEETKRLFDKAKSTDELLRGLDHVLTHNEMELRELDREMAKLEALEKSESAKVKAGEVDGRRKRNVLYHITRLRKQMDLYEQRSRIYRHNIDLHMRLIGRIQEMEAMKLRGVDEKQIEQVALQFDETKDRFEDAMHASAALDAEMSYGQTREERELAALEAEIMAGAEQPPAEEPAVQAPVAEATATEAAQTDESGRLAAPVTFAPVPPPVEHAIEEEIMGGGAGDGAGQVAEETGEQAPARRLETE
jgi:hypothetical protein